MQTEEVTFNRRTVGGAGIAWAIVQFLSVPLGMILIYVGMYMLTPPGLVLIAWDKLSMIFSFLPWPPMIVFFVSAIILSLLIIGLTIGVYRRNFVCAVLLFSDVAVYLIIAVYGLFIRITFPYDFNTFMYTANAIYIGIMLILILFMAGGVWGRSSRTYKLVKITAPIILVLAISAPMLIGWVGNTQLGSISGRIYQPDGTIVTSEADIFCKPPQGVYITSGDPMPECLVIHAQGDYMIDNLPAGDYIIWVRTTDYALFCDSPINVNVQTSQNTSKDIFLVPGGSISGKVTGIELDIIEDKPLKVECITKFEGFTWSYFSKSCTVAEDGTYSLEGIAPGTCTIKLENIWYSNSHHSQSETVTIKSGEHIEKDFLITR
jgi:hypothetical protein